MKRIEKKTYVSALFCLFIFSGSLIAASTSEFIQCKDWSRTGEVARISQEPLLVLFISDDCSYCSRLKTEYLHPMLQKKKNHLLIREVNIDNGGKMTDFDGIPIRSRLFASRYNIFATPTLVFLDSSGNLLTSSIVGYDDSDNYQDRMQKALSNSRTALEKKAYLSGSDL